MSQKKSLILFSGLLGLIVLALVARSIDLPDASERIARFPTAGPAFSSKPVELSDFEKDTLGEAQGYKAIYQWRGLRYAITMIDGTRNRQAVHDPRYCFRGAGWKIGEESTLDLAGGQARHVHLEREGDQADALFFYSDGKRAFDSPVEYWARTTARRWLRGLGGEEPVLVMVQPLDPRIGLDPAVHGLLPLLGIP
ncbi:hypothetical protein [Haloferula sargassicola]|uniref:Methanolan biosynthesis EpsI domain-containing protein n=1 Tax=Haloferula sargassicola TaxID=490096 RepID=A0ABP9UQL1_9BACT